jgi:chromosome segregation ATPase
MDTNDLASLPVGLLDRANETIRQLTESLNNSRIEIENLNMNMDLTMATYEKYKEKDKLLTDEINFLTEEKNKQIEINVSLQQDIEKLTTENVNQNNKIVELKEQLSSIKNALTSLNLEIVNVINGVQVIE